MLKTRVIAALVFAPAFLALVWLGGWYLRATCLVMGWLMLWEYLQLTLGARQVYLKVIAFGIGTTVALFALDLLPDLRLHIALPGPQRLGDHVLGIVMAVKAQHGRMGPVAGKWPGIPDLVVDIAVVDPDVGDNQVRPRRGIGLAHAGR